MVLYRITLAPLAEHLRVADQAKGLALNFFSESIYLGAYLGPQEEL